MEVRGFFIFLAAFEKKVISFFGRLLYLFVNKGTKKSIKKSVLFRQKDRTFQVKRPYFFYEKILPFIEKVQTLRHEIQTIKFLYLCHSKIKIITPK